VKFNPRILGASFSTAQVARLTGLSARQLDHWDRRGFLAPSIKKARGYGSARRYSFGDLVRLRLAGRLRASGIGLPQIRQCTATLKRLDPSRVGIEDARLLIAGGRVIWVQDDEQLVDILHEGQLMLVFPVGEAVRDMAKAAERLSVEAPVGLFDAPGVRAHRLS
jgi:DNA-binding transcriptional MerR regulator